MSPEELYGNQFNQKRYYAANGIEVIDVIEALVPTKPYRWHVLKYVLRAGKKAKETEVQDLRKAIWWIEREIASIERGQNPEPVNKRSCHCPSGGVKCLVDGGFRLNKEVYCRKAEEASPASRVE